MHFHLLLGQWPEGAEKKIGDSPARHVRGTQYQRKIYFGQSTPPLKTSDDERPLALVLLVKEGGAAAALVLPLVFAGPNLQKN